MKKKIKDNKKGGELGAVIENDAKNYPNTGEWKMEFPVIDQSKCIGCATCERVCPENTIEMIQESGKNKPVVKYDFCKGCGVCAEACPVSVIAMKKKNKQK